MLAEDLRFPKGKKLPTYLGRTKEKGQDLPLGEGAVKEEKFPHTRKTLQWQRQGVVGGKLLSHGGEPATEVQRAKRRDSRKEDQCQPALTSLRGLPAHPPWRMGTGS